GHWSHGRGGAGCRAPGHGRRHRAARTRMRVHGHVHRLWRPRRCLRGGCPCAGQGQRTVTSTADTAPAAPAKAVRAQPRSPFRLLAFALLCLVLVPGVGVSVNGNQNWISFGGPFRVQPSEAAKLALVLWSADVLTRKYKLLHQWKHLLVPLFPVAGAMLVLV